MSPRAATLRLPVAGFNGYDRTARGHHASEPFSALLVACVDIAEPPIANNSEIVSAAAALVAVIPLGGPASDDARDVIHVAREVVDRLAYAGVAISVATRRLRSARYKRKPCAMQGVMS